MIPNLTIFDGISCTINTTEDCNLRCKYCYEINKRHKSIDLDTCYKFIDFITDGNELDKLLRPDSDVKNNPLILDFIGGDSLMDPHLLDKILTYFNYKNALRENPRRWRCSISSNGTLFERKDVRDFCEKWAENISLGVSIDGCPEIHDMNRVYPDGSGSMQGILKYWDWYKNTFPVDSLGTKSTCAKDSIPYLYKSLVWMHEVLGLKYINQNFIYEDMHLTQEDLDMLDKQLEMCTKYVFEHRHEMHWTMIDEECYPDDKSKNMNAVCGSGRMIALGLDGAYYPCFRWLNHTQSNDKYKSLSFGNVNEGITHPEVYTIVSEGSKRGNCTKDPKCFECEYEPCCRYCIAGCYSEFGDFIRTTYICEVIKLQCKWARVYKKMLDEVNGENKESIKEVNK